jgi:hypothetical protein
MCPSFNFRPQNWSPASAAIQVGFELQQRIINSQPVVTNPPLQQRIMLLLSGQSLKDLQQPRSGGIQRVIEFRFVTNAALLPAKRLFPQIGDLAVDVQILPPKIVQLRG